MPNLASTLKSEIARLARKVIKEETAVLQRASAQHRHEIAGLKRELKSANRRLSLLESSNGRRQRVGLDATSVDGRRFSPKWVKTHRRKLGISAADYGKLVGVTGKTIYCWEHGNARPRGGAFRRWVAVRSLGKRQALALLESGA